MNAINYREKQYRVVSKSKFIISMVILMVLAILAITSISMLIFNFVPGLQDTRLNIFPKIYTEKDVNQITAKKDKEIKELQAQLRDETEKYAALETEYKKVSTSSIDEQTYNTIKKYEYVLNAPGSDFTPQDIAMVVNDCAKYSDDPNMPHLYFSLVGVESNYYSQAASRGSSARGWSQIIGSTGRYIYEDALKLGTNYDHNKMALNKNINAQMGIFYMIRAIDHAGINQGLINYDGGELGQKYADKVASNLKKNAGLSFADINPHFSKNYKPQ